MRVYVSPLLKSTANEQHLQRIAQIRRQIETGDPLFFSLVFSPRYPHWIKKIHRVWRLLATVKLIEQEPVLCLTHLLHRGSHEYADFLADPATWGEQQMQIPEAQLHHWLQQRQQLPPPPPPLTIDRLSPWLEKPNLFRPQDRVIFESEVWVERWRDQDWGLLNQWPTFHKILAHLLAIQPSDCRNLREHPPIQTVMQQYQLQGCWDPETHCTILYRLVQPQDRTDRQVIFLLAPFKQLPTGIDITRLGKELEMYGSTVAHNILAQPSTADQIAQFARRSYPDYLVYEPQIWHSLEQDQDANLALSGEEEALLDRMRFPAFINGRAGSGKSTMLYHAFAYYCDLYLQARHQGTDPASDEMLRPLFLTYSKSLTDRASQAVNNILTSHVCYQENLQAGEHTLPHLTADSLTQIGDCFRPFQAFLLEQLPPEAAKQFTPQRYISLHRFKQLYSHSFPHHKYSPELCWHAIRTYIKGFHFTEENEEGLTAEEYQSEVEQAYKSIDDHIFVDIYDKIWSWYRDLQKQAGYWDDQDLVRTVLRSIVQQQVTPQNYAAIFCDEAQDFTRLELQVILRLSIWSHCRLYPPVHNLPFAFAGDPMQTLNPTGFDWESLRASFYDRILLPLDPTGQLRLREQNLTELEELQQNYRSTREIVRFSNVVHLWRKVLFDLKPLKPQIPWRDKKHGISPQKGIMGENLVQAELEQIAESNIVFILPCDEGGEVDFLCRSPELRRLFPDVHQQSERPRNVYSAIAFKGMEFSQVIVCGFGEYFAQEFGEQPLHAFLDNPTQNLTLEYFLNKLYVAVSRSTQLLGIIDTQRGDRLLWQSAHAEPWLSCLSLEEQADWKTQVQPLFTQFNTTIFQQTQPLELAQIFLRSGLEQQNADFFETAAFYYDRAQCPAEADYCRAWLLRLQSQWRSAGERLMQIQLPSDGGLHPHREAWDCFWTGQEWQALLSWCNRYPAEPTAEWRAVIEFMVATSPPPDRADPAADRTVSKLTALQALKDFLESQEHWQQLQSEQDRIWRSLWTALRAELEDLLAAEPSVFSPEQWLAWQQLLGRITESGLIAEGSRELAARCAYRAENYPLAVRLWESGRGPTDRDHPDYCLAKAELLSAPEKFVWLHRSQRWDRVVAAWQQGRYQITSDWQPVLEGLRQALSHQGQFMDLLEVEMQLGRWVTVVQRLMQPIAPADSELNSTDQPVNHAADVSGNVFADPALRLRVFSRMAQDGRLTPAAIEREVEQQIEQTLKLESDVTENGRTDRGMREISARIHREQLDISRRLLCRFVTETTQLEDWVANPSNLQQAGSVFDRIGEFVPALRFYERFRTHADPELCELARDRWIAVKQRQAQRSEQMGNLKLAQKQRQDIATIEQTWRCLPSRPATSATDVRQSLLDRLATWPEAELAQIGEYLDFLEFRRRSGD